MQSKFSIPLLKPLLRTILPYFRSEARFNAWGLIALLLGLLVVTNGTNVVLGYVARDFTSALARKDSHSFFSLIPWYVFGLVVAAIIAAFYRYTEEKLVLRWREWLTQTTLKKYFFRRAYYFLKNNPSIDNPDQRIAEDVKNFTATSVSLFLVALNSVITIASFIFVLGSISKNLVYVLIGYAFFGTFLTIVIGKRLIKIHNRQYKREADFRYSTIRVGENAESIAFYRGEARERVNLVKRFQSVVRNTLRLIFWNRNLSMFTTLYNSLAIIIPTIVVAPLCLRGELEYGVVVQSADAFSRVLAAFSMIVLQFERISSYAAGVYRFDALWSALGGPGPAEEEAEESTIEVREGKILAVEDVTVRPPRSLHSLVENLSFSVGKGRSLLIMGASGCGKSSILRTIAGLWASGEGKIVRPRLNELMFLPQKPYLFKGSLRAQLLYPGRDKDHSDEQLKAILKQVNLESVLERTSGDLGFSIDWSTVLSLGEQQRVAFARVLAKRPSVLFLDEATSALDEENEEFLYSLIKKEGLSFISVGHRSTLRKFHDELLTLKGGAEWSLEPLANEATTK